MIVCKFGGTSVADAVQLNKVRDIVENDSRRRVIVVSAPAGMTNALLKIWEVLMSGGNWWIIWENEILSRFLKIAQNARLGMMTKLPDDAFNALKNGSASRDFVASRGEAIHSKIVAAFLHAKHVEASEVIKFDQSGQLDTEATYALLREKCGGDGRVVLGGFYGSLPNGQIKTLTRGGSDETAGHVAAALGAEACEIWTDVSGILSADPRVVDNPRRIDMISPAEVYELAYRGAKVLHPKAVASCAKLGIPIWILNTNRPEESGTLIGHNGNSRSPVTGIAGERPFTTFILRKMGMNEEKWFGAKALAVFGRFGVSYDQNPSGLDTMSIVVNSKALDGNTDRIVEELRRVCDAEVTVSRDHMALVTVVSRNMDNPQIQLTIFGALAMKKISTLMVSMSCGGTSFIIGVRVEDYERAMRAIYDAFFFT